jgi:translation initiation factor IF-1
MTPSALRCSGHAGGVGVLSARGVAATPSAWRGHEPSRAVRPGAADGPPALINRSSRFRHHRATHLVARGTTRRHRRRLEEEAISTKEETIEFEGEVTEALRNGMFRIALDNGHETIGYAAGRMRRYRIRIMLGDRVKVQLSAYDLNRGRIVYRYK